MVDKYETLGEVGHAIDGLKLQINTYAGIAGFLAVIGIGVIGFLYKKVDSVEVSNARIETKLNDIESKLDKIVADTGVIRTKIQTASVIAPSPNSGSFVGWTGTKLERLKDVFGTSTIDEAKYVEPAWIFLPANSEPPKKN